MRQADCQIDRIAGRFRSITNAIQHQLFLPAFAYTDNKIVKQCPRGPSHSAVCIEVIDDFYLAVLYFDTNAVDQVHLEGTFATLNRDLARVDVDFNTLR